MVLLVHLDGYTLPVVPHRDRSVLGINAHLETDNTQAVLARTTITTTMNIEYKYDYYFALIFCLCHWENTWKKGLRNEIISRVDVCLKYNYILDFCVLDVLTDVLYLESSILKLSSRALRCHRGRSVRLPSCTHGIRIEKAQH